MEIKSKLSLILNRIKLVFKRDIRTYNWIKIKDQLPPKNTLVWAKRSYRGKDDIYLAMRNGKELSTNPDPSRDDFWKGVPSEYLKYEGHDTSGIYFPYSFSDITVKEWRFLEPPILESEGSNEL